MGFTTGKYEPIVDSEYAIQLFKADAQGMGYRVEKSDANMPKIGFKIALFLCNDGDFHFMRMDNDGTWSAKDGYNGEIEKIEKDGQFLNPEQVDYGDEWAFLGIYLLW